MMYPLVTVVVPIYNVEKYLERCLKSIVFQTYECLEIILVDDGSSDGCPGICDNWAKKDDRIVVVHKENAGLGMARNTGIEKANGKYIFFFDSDDYVDLHIVEKCVKNAEEFSSDAVIYGRYDVFDNGKIEKRSLCARKKVFVGDDVKNILLPSMFTYGMGFGVSSCGKMYKLEAITRAQLRFISEHEIISEDAFFALEFFSHASVVTIVEENLYYYYKRTASLSRAFRADRQQKNDIFLIKSLDFVRNQNLSHVVEAHIKVRYHIFSIAAMKQISASQLTDEEKKIELRKILKNRILRDSIDFDNLALHKNSLRVFFCFLKLGCVSICEMMIRYKIQHSIT